MQDLQIDGSVSTEPPCTTEVPRFFIGGPADSTLERVPRDVYRYTKSSLSGSEDEPAVYRLVYFPISDDFIIPLFVHETMKIAEANHRFQRLLVSYYYKYVKE